MNSVKKENGKPWRIIDVINWGVDYFENKSFENPRLEIEIFLQHILGCKKIDLYINFENEVSSHDLNTLKGRYHGVACLSPHQAMHLRNCFEKGLQPFEPRYPTKRWLPGTDSNRRPDD